MTDREPREAVTGWAWVGLGGLATLLVPLWLLLTASLIQLDEFSAAGEAPTEPTIEIIVTESGQEQVMNVKPAVWPIAAYWSGVTLLFGIPIGLGLGTAATVARVAMDRRARDERATLDAMTRDDAVISGVEMITRGARSSTTASREALVLADVPSRVLAWLVDRGLLLVAGTPLLVLNPWVLERIRLPLPEWAGSLVTGLLVGSAVLLFVLLVVQLVGLLRTGQSIGKRWFGIRIATREGAVPGVGRIVALRRGAIAGLIVLTTLLFSAISPALAVVGALLWPTIDGLAWLGPDRRALHDQWAGTVVVKAASA